MSHARWHFCFSAEMSLARQRIFQRRCRSKAFYTAFTYTGFLMSPWILTIQPLLRPMSYYHYLQFIMSYYDVFMTKFHDLFWDVTDTMSNLRAFYKLFTECYEYITECYYSSRLVHVSNDLFMCCYKSWVCKQIVN